MIHAVERPQPHTPTHCTPEQYAAMYRASVETPDAFWLEQARRLDWSVFPEAGGDWSYDPVGIKWFADGRLNLCHNAVDRHLAAHGDRTALIFEADDPAAPARSLTYAELHREVVRMANALKKLGVKKGDRVTLYLPMILEGVVAMLACARLGAVHSVVFGGFSPEALAGRIEDCGSRFIITADEGLRGGKSVPLKANVDAALAEPDHETPVDGVLVVRHTGGAVTMAEGRDHWLEDLASDEDCPCEIMLAEDPLFILYTSGSTGKPKGIVHTTGGYLTGVASTTKYVFDLKEEDVYWCTADIGWITGHSYLVYGPLANGATCVVYEGAPDWPDKDRFWQICERYGVTIFYTAPTAIRAFMKWGSAHVEKHDLSQLRLLGSVGEPINPEAWMWYHKTIGKERCPIVDTWWQTETGGIMISPLPGVTATKPGSATVPFPGVQATLLDTQGKEVQTGGGLLAITRPWPSMLRTIWGDDQRYVDTYFSKWPGRPDLYFPGDGAKRDDDGYLWILGRVDDVLNVSGHRIGTMEVESALVDHPSVAEAAVVGKSHELKGQAIAAFVTLRAGFTQSAALRDELREHVALKIGALARPDDILFSADLPKTRSGKIMRRLLRDIAEGRALGDTTTLADPSVVNSLKAQYEATES